MQYIVWAVHDGGLLSLLALYTRLEWIYLYVLCFLFSVMLFDCFVFFWLILLISIFALFCCDNISVVELPRFEQFLILSVRFVGLFGLQSFWLLVVFLVLFSCTLFAFFLAIFMLFPIFWILFTHVTPCSSAYFACFLLFHSRMHHGISTDTWGVPGHLYHSPKNFCDGRVVTSDNIAGHICSPYTCHKYVLLDHLCFFLSCYSFRMYLGIPRHPSEPIVTDLSPSFPLMDVHTYMSLGENFPDQTWIESMLCRPMSVSFCLVCLYVHSTIPHHTHTNPSAPI